MDREFDADVLADSLVTGAVAAEACSFPDLLRFADDPDERLLLRFTEPLDRLLLELLLFTLPEERLLELLLFTDPDDLLVELPRFTVPLVLFVLEDRFRTLLVPRVRLTLVLPLFTVPLLVLVTADLLFTRVDLAVERTAVRLF